ncbi:MAG: carbohydrate-binding family 9-like protein [Acidobacteria bacterium]|nr:carbohydrate-binding family 9-like protein [Acidobacteriota bacterium]
MMDDDAVYKVCRAELDLEDPWGVPACARRVPLVRAGDGAAPRLSSEVAAYHDGRRVFVVFSVRDDHLVATHLEHDAPLWEEDVVEIFVAPESLERYFEIEVNPLGTTFDARVDSPRLERESMTVDRGWTCEGLRTAIRRTTIDGVVRVETVVLIPSAALGASCDSGTLWRANFYRIDRSPDGDEFSAWRPTGRTPPDFHVPRAFGTLLFE